MNLLNFAKILGLTAALCGSISAVGAAPKAATQTAQRRGPTRQADALREEFLFKLKDFKVEHQAELNSLQIQVRYTYQAGIKTAEYPDFIPMAKDVEVFLTNYPNESTYWEIVNKELTQMVLDKYPVLSSITCEIEVAPSQRHPYTRASIVTRQRARATTTPRRSH
jgi:hypothetical protein